MKKFEDSRIYQEMSKLNQEVEIKEEEWGNFYQVWEKIKQTEKYQLATIR